MPREHRPSRRLKLDDAPYDQLPVVISDPEGNVRVLRGPFDLTTLWPADRQVLQEHANKPFVVFTNRLGEHFLRGEGELMVIGEDLTKVGKTYFDSRQYMSGTESLTELAAKIREEAQRLLNGAARLEAAAADGWVLAQPEYFTWWDMEDTRPGPSFATRPRT